MYNIVENILEKHHYLLDEKIIIKELDNYQKENHYDFRYKELTIVPNVIELSLIKRIADICVKEDKKIKEAKKINKLIVNLKIQLLNHSEVLLSDYFNVDKSTNYSIIYLNENLRELGDHTNIIFKQLDNMLKARNKSMRDIINLEHIDNTETNIVIKNIFKTLNNVSLVSIEKLYENLNDIEQILMKDKHYSKMTLETKNIYRSYLKEKSKRVKSN